MKPHSVLLVLSLSLALATPVFADPGKGNGGGQGNGNGGANADGNNGNGNGGGPAEPKEHGGGPKDDKPEPPGQAKKDDKPGPATPAVAPGVTLVPNDQQAVQKAVQAKQALPLEAITAVVGADTGGRILDMQLVRFGGVYLYGVTVLERNGVLHKLYYDARSGEKVRTK